MLSAIPRRRGTHKNLNDDNPVNAPSVMAVIWLPLKYLVKEKQVLESFH